MTSSPSTSVDASQSSVKVPSLLSDSVEVIAPGSLGASLTGLTVMVTVLVSLSKAAVQLELTGLQLSGSPRSVTL